MLILFAVQLFGLCTAKRSMVVTVEENGIMMVGDESRLQTEKREHKFVHLADPQLGMKNQYSNALDWGAEKTMFTGLVKKAADLQPDFYFIGGDMQNYWPNEHDGVGRNRMNSVDKETPIQSNKFLASGELGRRQRADVLSALHASLPSEEEKIVFTAGNHDVGDLPDEYTLERYELNWGQQMQEMFQIDHTVYLQINSQFYYDPRASQLTAAKDQENFLKSAMDEVKKAKKSVARVVILTHIPPFMDKLDETHGWANWNMKSRIKVLNLLARTLGPMKVPVLFVCGHFHTNVEKSLQYHPLTEEGNVETEEISLDLDIIVTSAAGTTMWWDEANGDGHLDSADAKKVASLPIEEAFFGDIIKQCNYEGINKLMQPIPKRSGMRVFTMRSDGQFTSSWHTLAELESSNSKLNNVTKPVNPCS